MGLTITLRINTLADAMKDGNCRLDKLHEVVERQVAVVERQVVVAKKQVEIVEKGLALPLY